MLYNEHQSAITAAVHELAALAGEGGPELLQTLRAEAVLAAEDTNSNVTALVKLIALAIRNDSDKSSVKLSKMEQGLAKVWTARAMAGFSQLGLKTNLLKKIGDALSSGEYKASLDETMQALAAQLKENAQKFAIKDIKHLTRKLLGDVTIWMRTGSEPAKKRIMTDLGLLQDPMVNKLFVPEEHEGDKQGIAKKLERLIYKLTDWPGFYVLNFEEIKELRDTHPKELEQYSELRKEATAIYKTALQRIVRSSSDHLAKVGDLRKKFETAGIPFHLIPKGLADDYYMDEKGRIYTSAKKMIDGGPGPGVGVIMNPKYDPAEDNAFAFKSDADKGVMRYYTTGYRQDRREEKHDTVSKLIGVLPKIRKKWLSDLKSPKRRTRTMALIAEMAYLTVARIGSEKGETDGKRTHGITTWTVGHIKPIGTGLRIKYIGKSGVQQEIDLKPKDAGSKAAVAAMLSLMKGKGKNDYIFTNGATDTTEDENGEKTEKPSRLKPITSQQFNTYLRSIGSPASVHKLRSAEGTKIAQELINKAGLKPGSMKQPEAERWFKENIAKKVAIRLGHKNAKGEPIAMTSIKSYINPNITDLFFEKMKLARPKWLEALLRS